MAKRKISYCCSECGCRLNKWLGQCPDCKEWDTIVEQTVPLQPVSIGYAGETSAVQLLADIDLDTAPRLTTGMKEMDRVLGGGVMRGSVVLIGGDPGIGKSTVLLQAAAYMSNADLATLYVSGEESLQQIAMRARRLELPADRLTVIAETRVEQIIETALAKKPATMIIDSIQTMQTANLTATAGSVSQLREAAARLTPLAKATGIAIFLVGHVTKAGDLAGPRVLEHMIDVVCYVEGGRDNRYRMIRAVKNRFGAVNELGVFAMTERGMQEISNPSAIFLSAPAQTLPGSTVMVLWEGSRPLLVEVQALVDDSYADYPKRVTMGIDQARLVMLLAVLHKHGHLACYDKDVFINVVGGIRVSETAADTALLLSVISSLREQALPKQLITFGELGLAGEIRPVPNGEQRLREAAKHGFTRAIIPKANCPRKAPANMKVTGIERLEELLDCFADLGIRARD